MSTQPYNFDQQSAQRIANMVRNAERTAGAGSPLPPTAITRTPPWYAKLTSQSAGTPGHYCWTMVDLVNGAWTERAPRVFDSSCSAVDLNKASGLASGTIVLMGWAGYSTTATPDDPATAPPSGATGDTDLKSTVGPYPCFIFAAGDSLPAPGLTRQVLQLDDNLKAVWDWLQTP
jgi:hypothetical protein